MIRLNKTHSRSKGAAILSLVMSLAIVGILSGMYLGGGGGGAAGAKPWPIQQTDRARDSVCAANRRTALSELTYAQIDLGGAILSVDNLQTTAQKLPACPGEGKYYILRTDIYCSLHNQTPTYRSRLNL